MFDWSDLRHFLAVARHGSTIAAAKALNLSQSTVHRRLDELEKQIGRPVVIRQATGYRLTEFGKELLPLAMKVEDAVGSLERFLVASDETPIGSVRVTCSEPIGYRLDAVRDPRHVSRALPRRPDRTGHERPFSGHRQRRSRRRDTGRHSQRDGTGRAQDRRRPVGALLQPSLCRTATARIERTEDLDRHAIIEFDGGIRDHHAARWLRSVAPNAKVVARSNTVPGLVMTVRSGAGLAPLPMPLAGGEPDLVCMLGPLPGLYSPIYLLTHPDLRRTPRVGAFFDFVIDELESIRTVLTSFREVAPGDRKGAWDG